MMDTDSEICTAPNRFLIQEFRVICVGGMAGIEPTLSKSNGPCSRIANKANTTEKQNRAIKSQ
jgi:hypothetical protein